MIYNLNYEILFLFMYRQIAQLSTFWYFQLKKKITYVST